MAYKDKIQAEKLKIVLGDRLFNRGGFAAGFL
jgi:hypothetical protein